MDHGRRRVRMSVVFRRPAAAFVMAAAVAAGGSPASAQRIAEVGPSEPDRTAVHRADDGALRASALREGARLIRSSSQGSQTGQDHWLVRHPVIVGAMAGAAGGAVLSRVETIGGRNHDARVALVGAGAGAWAGLIASAVHKAHAGEKVGIGTKIAIAAGAVGLVVLPVLACYGAGGCGGSS
jgi:hypothetical protein